MGPTHPTPPMVPQVNKSSGVNLSLGHLYPLLLRVDWWASPSNFNKKNEFDLVA